MAEQYLKKGAKVYIEGALQTRKWQGQDGQDRYSTEVVLQGFNSVLTMLDGRSGGGMSEGGQADYAAAATAATRMPRALRRAVAAAALPRAAATSTSSSTTRFLSKPRVTSFTATRFPVYPSTNCRGARSGTVLSGRDSPPIVAGPSFD